MHEVASLEKPTSNRLFDAIQITTQQTKYTFSSFLFRDTAYDLIHNAWRSSRSDGNAMSSITQHDTQATPIGKMTADTSVRKVYEEPEPLRETALDSVFPGTPEKVYNLMFGSGFLKDFMAGPQKLLDVKISDWEPLSLGSNVLTRNTSYIKPLNQALGPRQTRCDIKEEITLTHFDRYVSVLTTTRTPDVPSGGMFSVKTRTSITRKSATASRALVTTQLEWTGRSFIRSIVERFAIEGQKIYYTDLECAMRHYISQHQSEFLIESATSGVKSQSDFHPGQVTDGTTTVLGSNREHGLVDSLLITPDDHEDHDFEIIHPPDTMISLEEMGLDEQWVHIDGIEYLILQGWRR